MRAGHIVLAAIAGFTSGIVAFLSGFSFWMSLLIYSGAGMAALLLALVITLGGGLLLGAFKGTLKPKLTQPAMAASVTLR